MKKKNLLLTAVATLGLAATTLAQTVPNYVPTNGLVGWWPFNGNANDESGNGNNGTVNGATLTADRFGNANKAYSFNGTSNYIDLMNTNYNDFSISGWFNADTLKSYTVQNIGQKIFSKFTNSTFNGWEIELTPTGYVSGMGLVNPNMSFINNWYFISLVYTSNNQKMTLFQNGLPVDTIFSFTNTPNSAPIRIGARPNLSGNLFYFDGKLDDIGIWNRALTQQEITDLYNGNICYQTITVTDTLIINTNLIGFNPVTYQNSIKIFPNPTNDHVTIYYGNFATLSGYQLKIENSLGQQVFQTSINQQSTINQQSSYLNLSNWGGNGIYFVRLIDPQGNTIDIRKIVLQ
jgi:hypothetical protein